MLESYLGYKTEIVAQSGERNYQYLVREVDDGVFAVVPGKFSLAFSLAVNMFKRLTGEVPAVDLKLKAAAEIKPYIGLTKHAALVKTFNKKKTATQEMEGVPDLVIHH